MSDFILRYLTYSTVRAVFGRSLSGFHSVADPLSSAHLQTAVTEQSFQSFSRNFATIVRYPKPSFRNVSIRALSSNWLFYRNGPALVSPAADHATRLWCWSCSAEPWCLLTAVQCHVITTELTLTRPRNSIHWVTECGTFPPPSRTISIPT